MSTYMPRCPGYLRKRYIDISGSRRAAKADPGLASEEIDSGFKLLRRALASSNTKSTMLV
jgi:hypothetical protein